MTSVSGFIAYKGMCSSGSYDGDSVRACRSVFSEMLAGIADEERYGPQDALTGSPTVLRKFASNQEEEAGLMVTFSEPNL
jgi:hypothetical protein